MESKFTLKDRLRRTRSAILSFGSQVNTKAHTRFEAACTNQPNRNNLLRNQTDIPTSAGHPANASPRSASGNPSPGRWNGTCEMPATYCSATSHTGCPRQTATRTPSSKSRSTGLQALDYGLSPVPCLPCFKPQDDLEILHLHLHRRQNKPQSLIKMTRKTPGRTKHTNTTQTPGIDCPVLPSQRVRSFKSTPTTPRGFLPRP